MSRVIRHYGRRRIGNIVYKCVSPYREPCRRVYRTLSLPYCKAGSRFFCVASGRTFGGVYVRGDISIVPRCARRRTLSKRMRFPLFIGPISDENSHKRSIYCAMRRLRGTVDFTGDRSSGKSVLVRGCVGKTRRFRIACFFIGNRTCLVEAMSDCYNSRRGRLRGIMTYTISPSEFASRCLGATRRGIIGVFGTVKCGGNPVFVRKFRSSNGFEFFSPNLEFPKISCREICAGRFNVSLVRTVIRCTLRNGYNGIGPLSSNIGLGNGHTTILFPALGTNGITGVRKFSEVSGYGMISLVPEYRVKDRVP